MLKKSLLVVGLILSSKQVHSQTPTSDEIEAEQS